MAKSSKGRKQHVSMRGKTVDMDMLRKKNELTPAIGNARVNARGDELGPGGKIIRKREEIVNEFYKTNNAVKDEAKVPTKTAVNKANLTAAEKELLEEDEWIENEDGDFVKKGA